jgi:hypothetical protein
MKFYKIVLFVLSILILISCGRKEFTEAGIDEIVEEYNEILETTAESKNFDWGDAIAFSNFTAYFSDSELIFINEDYRRRFPFEAFNRYYFKDGNLIYFIGRELDRTTKEKKELTLYVDPKGNVIRYDKIFKGERASLEKEESDYVLSHAKELYNAVQFKLAAVE